MIWYHFALIAASILELREQRANDVSIPAMDVHEFMLEKAKCCAITQVILNDMRYVEVLLLLHQAKETWDAKQFVAALKFATTLITTTYATKYTYIHATFLIWWHCVSEAERTIYQEFVMKKKTKKGKTILIHRFVEWMVKHIRDMVGNHYRFGTTNKLRWGAILLDNKKKLCHQFKETFKIFSDGANDEKDNEDEIITFTKLAEAIGSVVVCMELVCLASVSSGGPLKTLIWHWAAKKTVINND